MVNPLLSEVYGRLGIDEEEEDDSLEPFKNPLLNEVAERLGKLPEGTGRRERMRRKSAEVEGVPKETPETSRERRAMASMTLPTPPEREELDKGEQRARAQDAVRRAIGLPPRQAQRYGQQKAQEMIERYQPTGEQQAEIHRYGPTGHLAERAAMSGLVGAEGPPPAPPPEKGAFERLQQAAGANIPGLARSVAGAMEGFAALEPEEVAGGPWGGLSEPMAAVLRPFQEGIARGMLKPTEATVEFLEEALGMDPQESFSKRFKKDPFITGLESGLSNVHSFAATMGASAMGGAIAGPVGATMGGLAAAGGQIYGNTYAGAIEEGYDETTAQQLAIITSLGEMGLEYFPAAKLTKLFKTPTARKGVAKLLGATVQQMAAEGATEMTQEVWNMAVESMVSLDEQGIDWEQFAQNMPPDAFWRVVESGIAGALIGAPAGTAAGLMAPTEPAGRDQGPPPEAGPLALPPGPDPSSLALPPGPQPKGLLTEGTQLPYRGRPAEPSPMEPAGLLPRAIESRAPDPMSMIQPELPDTTQIPEAGARGPIDQLGTAPGPPWDPGLGIAPTPEGQPPPTQPPPEGPPEPPGAGPPMPPKNIPPPRDPTFLGYGPQRVPEGPVISPFDVLTPEERTDQPEALVAEYLGDQPSLEQDIGDPRDALDQLSPENRPTEALGTAIGPPWDPDLTLEDVVEETPFNVLGGMPERVPPEQPYVPLDVNDAERIEGMLWYHGTGREEFEELGLADPLLYPDYGALYGAGLYLTDSGEVANSYRLARTGEAIHRLAAEQLAAEQGVSMNDLDLQEIYERAAQINEQVGQVLVGKLPPGIRLLDLEAPLPDDAYQAFQSYYDGLNWKVGGLAQLPRDATGSDLYSMLVQATTMHLSRAQADEAMIRDTLAPLTLKLQGLLMNLGYHGYRHEGGNLIGGGKKNHNVVILWGDPWQRFGKLAGGVDPRRGTMRQTTTTDPWGRPGRGGPVSTRETGERATQPPPVEEAPREPEELAEEEPIAPEIEELLEEEEVPTEPEEIEPEEIDLPDIEVASEGDPDSAIDALGDTWGFTWAVVELTELLPSHDEETRKPTPGYDQSLQRRGRGGRLASEAQVEEISKNPRGFFDSGERLNSGAPIINRQGEVIDGNGRTMGLLRKLRNGKYKGFAKTTRRNAKKKYGITVPKDMENPVIVRISHAISKRTARRCLPPSRRSRMPSTSPTR
jgi:hypothetical protein